MPRLPLAVAALAAAIALAPLPACKRGTPPPAGNIAAQLTIPTRAGAAFDPSALAGKPTLVVFWRPGCPYCLQELPDALRAAKERGVPAVAIQIAESKAAGQAALERIGWQGEGLHDLYDDGTLRRALGVSSVPYTLILRSSGTAARAFVGRKRYDDLHGELGGVN